MAYLKDLWRYIERGHIAVHRIGDYVECVYRGYAYATHADGYSCNERSYADFNDVLRDVAQLKVPSYFHGLPGYVNYKDIREDGWVILPEDALDKVLSDVVNCVDTTEYSEEEYSDFMFENRVEDDTL